MAPSCARSLPLLAALALALPGGVLADEQPQPPPSPHTFTGNMTLVSDYRFRGLSQTFSEGGDFGPAFQGGFDYAHRFGWYVGNWNSNVSGNQYPDGSSLEMDFYGGFKRAWGTWGIDLGTIYYYYPGSRFVGVTTAAGAVRSVHIANWELYTGASWRWFSAKYYYSLTNYFGGTEDVIVSLDNPRVLRGPLRRNGGTRGTQYLTGALSVPVIDRLTAIASIGATWVRNYPQLDYIDYRIGLSYDLYGWLLGVALVGTNADPNFYFAASGSGRVKKIGQPGFVLGVGRIF